MDLNHEGSQGQDGRRHGGQVREDGSYEARVYHASSIPGHHLPHAWLVDRHGKKVSTQELVKRDKMVLVSENVLWKNVEQDPVEVVILGEEEEGGLRSVDRVWENVRGISAKGAMLVGPDGIMAWR